MYSRFILDRVHIDNTYAFLCAYIYMYIYVSLTYSHSKLANFTIIKNKWTVLKLLQNFEFLLRKNSLYTNYNVN
jgi:hypothetical protein